MAIIIQGTGGGSTLRCDNFNDTTGQFSTVAGGCRNFANGNTSSILGGRLNRAMTLLSVVGGGESNTICGTSLLNGSNLSIVGGGFNNSIIGDTQSSNCSAIGGGAHNHINSSNEVFIGGGLRNCVTACSPNSTIGGGNLNLIRENSQASTIGGGQCNLTWGITSVIGGGCRNSNLTNSSVIGGGSGNTITRFTCSVNQTYGAFIGGGRKNVVNAATSCYSTIGGGFSNTTVGGSSVIGGGSFNTSFFGFDSVLGGCRNSALGGCNFIGGGTCNTTTSSNTVVGGGFGNKIYGTSRSSIIGGGLSNTVTGLFSGILGGCSNTVTGNFSFISSINSTVTANCSAVVGGSNIIANVDNSVYVPQLNIRDLPNTNPIFGLGIDANGFVVASLAPGANCVVDGVLVEGSPTSLLPQIPSISVSLINGNLQLIGSSVLYDDYTNSFNTTTGIWTCPQTGRWNISYFAHLTGPDPTTGWEDQNGMLYAGILNFTTNEVYAASTYYPANIQLYSDINGGQWGVQLTAGDQLCVRITNTTILSYSPVPGVDYVRFSAQKIG
jgi:hypothetical protein